MKKSYLQNLPKPTDFKNEAYNLYLADIQKRFELITQNYSRESCQHLM